MVEWHTWHVQCKRNYGDSGKDKARRRSCVKLAMETMSGAIGGFKTNIGGYRI